MDKPSPGFDTAAVYRISFWGCLSPSWSDRLNGMTVTTWGEECEEPLTVLSGPLPDQAALMGVLNILYSLHFPLLKVEHLADC